jgi:branched-chain amino acid transport system substrate-binding protein
LCWQRDVLKATKGKFSPNEAMAFFKNWKNPDSPRGPIMIDPETRDILQNIYLRRVEEVDGKLANVEFETISDGQGSVERT